MSPPGKRLVHSSNKINPHSSTPASSVPSTPKTNELHYSSNVSMASQSRSDYSSSSSQHERVSHAEEPLHPSFKSRQTNNSALDHSIASPPTSSEISSVPESRQGLGLCKLKPNWAETRPVSRRIILRPVSSPALTDSGDTSSPPRPDTKSKPSVLVKKKSSKYLRKVSSVPEEMRPKCRPEKKKSQPSRTQPYEAPYFFPPPIPIDRTSSRGKLPRTQTLPSPQRRQLASPVPPLPVRGPIASR